LGKYFGFFKAGVKSFFEKCHMQFYMYKSKQVAFANLFMAEIETKIFNQSIHDVFSLWDVIKQDIDHSIQL